MQVIMAVAAGGAIGSVLRYFCAKAAIAMMGANFPYGTLFVNVTGSFLMGVLIAFFASQHDIISQEWKIFFTVGVLGGFTTFSTFSLDTVTLFERGDFLGAGLYILFSLTLSLAAIFCGLYFTRSFIS